MKYYYTIAFTLISTLTFGQNNKQNIRGVIIDKLTQAPLKGATVSLNNNKKSVIADTNGLYTISELNPGRYDVKVSYNGFKDAYIPNVVVTSGKETILEVSGEEDFKNLKDVVVK